MNQDPKPKTIHDEPYKKWLKTQPCVKCRREKIEGVLDIVPTHQGGGMALKGDDTAAMPLCVYCHADEHAAPETFWAIIEVATGNTRQDYVDEHRERYLNR